MINEDAGREAQVADAPQASESCADAQAAAERAGSVPEAMDGPLGESRREEAGPAGGRDALLGYVAYRGIHGGTVKRVFNANGEALVFVQAPDGGFLKIEFSGVASVQSHRATGLVVHALAEMQGPDAGRRRFCFVPAAQSTASSLEVVAAGVRIS